MENRFAWEVDSTEETPPPPPTDAEMLRPFVREGAADFLICFCRRGLAFGALVAVFNLGERDWRGCRDGLYSPPFLSIP